MKFLIRVIFFFCHQSIYVPQRLSWGCSAVVSSQCMYAMVVVFVIVFLSRLLYLLLFACSRHESYPSLLGGHKMYCTETNERTSAIPTRVAYVFLGCLCCGSLVQKYLFYKKKNMLFVATGYNETELLHRLLLKIALVFFTLKDFCGGLKSE